MAEAFLDSSVLIGLVFRQAPERNTCRASLPPDASPKCSRYTVFEVARGYLRSLIALNNYSLESSSFADLHRAAHSGQQRFKPYAMHTWLGAFDDYFKALEREDGPLTEALNLEEFRAKLRGWIRRGWRRMLTEYILINEIGCREDIPPPLVRANQLIDQPLPIAECGQPAACKLQTFVKARKPDFARVIAGLDTLPPLHRDRETEQRIEGLRHLLAMSLGTPFDGEKCHRCGDALVCLEAPPDHVIATKNKKHFEPLSRILGKPLAIAGP